MMDEERDELLRGIAAKVDGLAEDLRQVRETQREQGETLAGLVERLERIEKEHGSALRAHLEQLHAIRMVLTGDRAQHYQLAERVAELEREAG